MAVIIRLTAKLGGKTPVAHIGTDAGEALTLAQFALKLGASVRISVQSDGVAVGFFSAATMAAFEDMESAILDRLADY